LLVFKENEADFVKRAQSLVVEERIYLLMGMGSISVGSKRPAKNKAVLLTPEGEVAYSYLKSHLVPGWEATNAVPGDGRLPISETELGRMSSPICFEMDFPNYIRKAARQNPDLMVVPANDWKEIKTLHHQMAVFRAIENGTPMLRASSAFSGAVDAFGRVLAVADHFAPEVRTMVAYVPLRRARTAYTAVGDLFSWLSITGLLALIVSVVLGSRT
jgi:apolipoprotein N-acyltransferase